MDRTVGLRDLSVVKSLRAMTRSLGGECGAAGRFSLLHESPCLKFSINYLLKSQIPTKILLSKTICRRVRHEIKLDERV